MSTAQPPAPPTDPSSHPSASSTNSDTGSTSAAMEDVPNEMERVKASINTIEKDKKMNESTLKHIHKLLTTLMRSPSSLSSRKFRSDNIAFKKFVLDVSGGGELLQAVGFHIDTVKQGEKEIVYWVMDEGDVSKNSSVLNQAVDVIQSSLTSLEEGKKNVGVAATAEPAVRKLCVANCGFFGSAETEGYCSVCFKKKFIGAPAKASPTSPASALRSTTTAASPSTLATPAPNITASSFFTPKKCVTGSCSNLAKDINKNGLCDSCYERDRKSVTLTPEREGKEAEEKKQEEMKTNELNTQNGEIKRWKCLFHGAILKLRAVHRFNKGKKPVQLHKNRCWKCNKKVGITGFECRCRYIFCAADRYADKHDCPYDIKSEHRKRLRKENAEIRAAKLDKL